MGVVSSERTSYELPSLLDVEWTAETHERVVPSAQTKTNTNMGQPGCFIDAYAGELAPGRLDAADLASSLPSLNGCSSSPSPLPSPIPSPSPVPSLGPFASRFPFIPFLAALAIPLSPAPLLVLELGADGPRVVPGWDGGGVASFTFLCEEDEAGRVGDGEGEGMGEGRVGEPEGDEVGMDERGWGVPGMARAQSADTQREEGERDQTRQLYGGGEKERVEERVSVVFLL